MLLKNNNSGFTSKFTCNKKTTKIEDWGHMKIEESKIISECSDRERKPFILVYKRSESVTFLKNHT